MAGGRPDHRRKRAQTVEKTENPFGFAAIEMLALHHRTLLVYHANTDSLPVEVDADKVHGSLLAWKQRETETLRPFTTGSRHREPIRLPVS